MVTKSKTYRVSLSTRAGDQWFVDESFSSKSEAQIWIDSRVRLLRENDTEAEIVKVEVV